MTDSRILGFLLILMGTTGDWYRESATRRVLHGFDRWLGLSALNSCFIRPLYEVNTPGLLNSSLIYHSLGRLGSAIVSQLACLWSWIINSKFYLLSRHWAWLFRLENVLLFLILFLSFLPTMGVIALVALAVTLFALRVISGQVKLRYGPLAIWILFFALVIFFAVIFSADPGSSVKVGLVLFLFLLFYFVIINTVNNKRLFYSIILALMLSAALQSTYGLYQYHTGVPMVNESWTDPKLFPEINTRVFGTMDNPNILAQYLELILPLTLALCWSIRGARKKLGLAGLAALMSLCLLLTYSRTGWVAIVLSVLVFGLLRDRRVLLLGLIAGIAALNYAPNTFVNRLTSITNSGDSSMMYRTFVWKSALIMIRDFWYNGVGLGVTVFQKIYNAYYMREGVYAFHTHNLYLQMLVETGVLGLLSFLAVVFMNVKYGLNSMVKSVSPMTRTVQAALLAGMAGFLFHGITENSFYNFKIVLLFWMVMALIMALRDMETRGANDEAAVCNH